MDFDENNNLNNATSVGDNENQSQDFEISTNTNELLAKYNDVVDIESEGVDEQQIKAIDISQITKYISEKYSNGHDNELFINLLDSIGRGNNKVVQNMIEQTLTVNTDWIDAIIDGLNAMERIVLKPKLSIKDERDLVKLEKAKRVDAVAVKHLSTHTQYVKQIREDGFVVPSKVLTRTLETETAIYENRFLYALLLRMKAFVGKRYDVIVEHAKVKDNTVLSYSSSFKYGRAEIDCRLNVGVKYDKELTKAQADNQELLSKLELVKNRIASLEGSSFMREMKNAKLVVPPIQRTNILTSNTEYSQCYRLWMMLSSYNTVGYSVNIMEKQLPIDGTYFEDLTKIVATSAQVMLINNKVREAIYAQVKPTKVLQKEFKVSKNVSLLTNVFSGKKSAKDKDIYDFYYERMKAMLMHLSDLADSLAVTGENEIPRKALFKTIFNQVQKVNNDMYDEVLKLESLEGKRDSTDSLEAKYQTQKKLCERYEQLRQLKEMEAKKALLEQNAQYKKLDEIAIRLQKQKQAEKLKAEREKALKEKQRLAKQKQQELLKQKELARKQRERERKHRHLEQEKQKKAQKLKRERERLMQQKRKAAEQLKQKELLRKQKEKEKKQKLLEQERLKKELKLKREKERRLRQKQKAEEAKQKRANDIERQKKRLEARKKREALEKQREKRRLERENKKMLLEQARLQRQQEKEQREQELLRKQKERVRLTKLRQKKLLEIEKEKERKFFDKEKVKKELAARKRQEELKRKRLEAEKLKEQEAKAQQEAAKKAKPKSNSKLAFKKVKKENQVVDKYAGMPFYIKQKHIRSDNYGKIVEEKKKKDD